jgi:IclR family acetate operon transcriptional repressor
VAALDRELERVRGSGIALDRGEYHEFVTCVAAPILDPEGYPVASVGISSVTPLLDRDPRRRRLVTAAVRACAARVTRQLAGASRPAGPDRPAIPPGPARRRRPSGRQGRADA